MTSTHAENNNPSPNTAGLHPEQGYGDLFDTFETVELAPESPNHPSAGEPSAPLFDAPPMTKEPLKTESVIEPTVDAMAEMMPTSQAPENNGAESNGAENNGAAEMLGTGPASGDRDGFRLSPTTQQNIEDVTAAALSLETQLEQIGVLKHDSIQKAVQYLIQACQELPEDVREQIKAAIDKEFRALWQQKQTIATLIHAEGNLSSLLKQATSLIQRMLGVDRALVFKFKDIGHGTVVMESLSTGWTPSYGEFLPAIYFGLADATEYQRQPISIVKNTMGWIQSPHQKQLLDMFQVETSLAVPITFNGGIWGLLVVQQCQRSRQWTGYEATILDEMAKILALRLQPVELEQQQQQWVDQTNVLTTIINHIHYADGVDSVFRTATHDLRKQLACDRVAIYRFNPDWTGEFVAESVAPGWIPLMQEQLNNPVLTQNINECSVKELVGNNPKVADTHLRQTNGGRFNRGETYRVCPDIYEAGFSSCYIDMLERYQARAYIMVAMYQNEQLWGLLAIYQNSSSRQWTSAEVSMLNQVGTQLSIALQQSQYRDEMNHAIHRERGLAKIISRIRQSSDIDAIFKTVTAETRQLLNCDRIGVYRFNDDWSGQFIAESVGTGWEPLLELQKSHPRLLDNISECSAKDLARGSGRIADTYLQTTRGGQFSRGELYRVAPDIYNAGFSACYLEILELYQVRSYVIVALYYENDLWGLIAAYQNSEPRHWKPGEIDLLVQISNQLGVALQQTEYLKAMHQAAEREKTVNQIANRIRKVFDLNKVFKTTTQDVRQYLRCDRVAIYQFNDDWSGEFIAESFTGGWIALLNEQNDNPALKENISECSAKEMAKADVLQPDTYLQQTQGGVYRQGILYRVQNDIYKAGFSPCYLEILESYQARAYVIVAIYKEQKLWGLLAAYQNSGPRRWEQDDVNFLVQIASQLGIALQQIEFIGQIQQQSDQLDAIAKRTLAYNTLINKLGQLIIQQAKTTSPPEKLMKVAATEIRRLLDADRVAFYQFNPDWSGKFILEDVGSQGLPLVDTDLAHIEDTYLQDTQGGRYRNNESLRVADIYAENYQNCHIELLEQWGVKAYMLTPIFVGDVLWGILGAYYNRGSRQWQDYELDLLIQSGIQISIALQQSQSAAALRQQSQALAETAARDKAAKDALQQQIMHMLMAVRPALDGDLTVRAPVTEDAVGTVADAYNNTIQALRQLVAQVKDAAQQVGQTSEGSQSAIAKMTAQTERELEEINQALIQIQLMVDSTRSVADSAQQVETAVQQANQVVQSGDEAMNLTVGGIQQIRDTVAETSKKIKRLGESSQRISKVVSLISNFTTQTNLLAINAAIEATRAGEYGRGFAVVADEVRSLAQQSDDATTEIEQLVQDIQAEVSAVSLAMDTGIQEVVRGTDLVTQTRQSLTDIVQATAQISELVDGITKATQAQKAQSESVIQIINRVTETARQTSEESATISASFQNLLATSQTLQSNVDRFKVE